ncbi:hypothetical protein BDY19DRAFT_954743 [Irpex rosettiformis]|uniref:Uncharacterized protein n=1 Tax=Irpex rosettiformis TaxID=378272 RepID=A0ACB8U051_9APHY|nr:hypothetical protein BDY19DRAFT_954743 [Irpex rosettiformis]
MGVPGLWAALREAGVPRSLSNIAVVDGFQSATTSAHTHFDPHPRALRIGIDASIWFVHAEYGKEGENPELRTIFFRLTRLLQVPFLPLFVFDGPLRPEMKRGKLIDTKPNWMVEGLKTMIEAFGFEWRMAPGEAEAELAYLNRIGVIDAVWTDDVDTLVFGATLVIRNQSKNLSGNRAHDLTNSDGRDDKNHTMTFSAEDIKRHPKVNLDQEGLILIALLSGGDYSKGVEGCGPQVAAALAQCGFGDSLVNKIRSLSLSISLGLQTNGTGSRKASKTRVTLGSAEKAELMRWLEGWREELCDELRTNSRGLMKKKTPSLAAKIQQSKWVPDLQVLMAYVNPVTSEERAIAKALLKLFQRRSREDTPSYEVDRVVAKAKREIADELRDQIVWADDPDIGAIARVCEDRFEWGVKDIIIKRFRSWLWSGVVCRMLRRAAINHDQNCRRSSTPVGSQRDIAAQRLEILTMSSPSKGASQDPLQDVHGVSNDGIPENNSFIVKIHSSRSHASTDGLLEYRLEIDPSNFVKAVEEGIEGKREIPKTGWTDSEGDDEDEDDEAPKTRKKGSDSTPTDHLRIWMPACMVSIVVPELVQAFEERASKKATKGKGKGVAKGVRAKSTTTISRTHSSQLPPTEGSDDDLVLMPPALKKATAVLSRISYKKSILAPTADEDEDEDTELPLPSRPAIRAGIAPTAAMPDFFKASKPGTATFTQSKKPSAKPKATGSNTRSTSSSTARVASLFDDPEVQIFRDLTTRVDKFAPPKPKAGASKPTLRKPPTSTLSDVRKVSCTKPTATVGYIEISSDSDVPAPSKLATRPALRQRPESDVIDLCTDSD